MEKSGKKWDSPTRQSKRRRRPMGGDSGSYEPASPASSVTHVSTRHVETLHTHLDEVTATVDESLAQAALGGTVEADLADTLDSLVDDGQLTYSA